MSHKNFDAHRAQVLRKMHDDRVKAAAAQKKAAEKAAKETPVAVVDEDGAAEVSIEADLARMDDGPSMDGTTT